MRAMRTPHRLTVLALTVFTAAATPACSQGCSSPEAAAPHIPASSDPAGKDLATVRRIRDEIDRRVRALLAELVPSA